MVMRVSGFASGMDIDSIVSDMMKAQRAPLNKLLQKKQVLEWQRDDYRSMNTLLLNFRTNELTNMRLTTTYRTKSVSSSDESKVSATATSAAGQSSYNISQVNQLATAEVRKNTGSIGLTSADSGIYKQFPDDIKKIKDSDGNPVWKDGAILTSPTKKTAEAKQIFDLKTDLKLENFKEDEVASWSVKVDGKAYKVVTDDSSDPLTDNTVLIKDGELKFNTKLAVNSVININYTAKYRTDELTIGKDQSTLQLSNKEISLWSEPGGDVNGSITLNITDKNGKVAKEPVNICELTSEGNRSLRYNGAEIGFLNEETGKVTFTSDTFKSNEENTYRLEVKYTNKYSSFAIDTVTSKGNKYESFLVSGNDSLNSVITKVNNSFVGASLFYDSGTGHMTLTRNETGDHNKGKVQTSTSGNFMEYVLKFANVPVAPDVPSANSGKDVINQYNDYLENSGIIEKGQNAVFDINGLSTNRNSNTFTIDGVTFTLKQIFEATNKPVTIGVSNDNTKVYDNIKGFIDKYNELIETIQKKTNETRNKDYQPLTDDEREGLSDKQQEKWEEIAKSGLLRRDTILTGVLSQMRTGFYSTVNNSEISSTYNQLAKIGISTSSNYLDGGKLVIDEAKLKAAIEADPNSVEQLFRGENGIVQNLTETVNSTMDKLKAKAGNSFSTNDNFTIGKELSTIAKRQESFENRLEQLEKRYWAQFTAMEQAIQRANSQSANLMQFFSN